MNWRIEDIPLGLGPTGFSLGRHRYYVGDDKVRVRVRRGPGGQSYIFEFQLLESDLKFSLNIHREEVLHYASPGLGGAIEVSASDGCAAIGITGLTRTPTTSESNELRNLVFNMLVFHASVLVPTRPPPKSLEFVDWVAQKLNLANLDIT